MLFWPVVIALGLGTLLRLYYDHDVKSFTHQNVCEQTLPDLEQRAKEAKDFMNAVTDAAGDKSSEVVFPARLHRQDPAAGISARVAQPARSGRRRLKHLERNRFRPNRLALQSGMSCGSIGIPLRLLFEHDLFGKPDSTFPDHAPAFQRGMVFAAVNGLTARAPCAAPRASLRFRARGWRTMRAQADPCQRRRSRCASPRRPCCADSTPCRSDRGDS